MREEHRGNMYGESVGQAQGTLKPEWPESTPIPSCTRGSEWMKAARDASPGSGRLLLALPAFGATILLFVWGTGSFFKREDKKMPEGRRGKGVKQPCETKQYKNPENRFSTIFYNRKPLTTC